MSGRRGQRAFGYIRKLLSKRFQASYVGPDGGRHVAPTTFTAKVDAEGWLAAARKTIEAGEWTAGHGRAAGEPEEHLTLGQYANAWLSGRQLRPRTRDHYRDLLDRFILPGLGHRLLGEVTPVDVRLWHASLDARRPTQRAHAYALLRTIFNTALADDLITANPCRIPGAGVAKRTRPIEPATLDELEVITEVMPERLRLMVLFGAWLGLRFGELTELRRGDVDVRNGVVRVRRGVVRDRTGEFIVGEPKTDAGSRDVAIPPHLLPVVRSHLAKHVPTGTDALLFPAARGGHMPEASFRGYYYPARRAAGREDLAFHHLRHTGAVLAASTGATIAELMARLGHTTPAMAMRYQHAARGRDKEIAAALSRLIEDGTGQRTT